MNDLHINNEPKTHSVSFRVSESEFERLNNLAKSKGVKMAKLLQELVTNNLDYLELTNCVDMVKYRLEKIVDERLSDTENKINERLSDIENRVDLQANRLAKMTYKNLVSSNESKRLAEISAKHIITRSGQQPFEVVREDIKVAAIKESNLREGRSENNV